MSADRAKVGFPPPVIYVLAVTLGIVVHQLTPISIDLAWATRIAVGVPLVAAGLYFAAGAVRKFRATGQDERPWTPTPSLIVDGIYRSSRNPMYVAMGLWQAAFGVLLSNGWILIFLPVSFLAVYLIAVRPEENYLRGKFGPEYAQYQQRVRRWL